MMLNKLKKEIRKAANPVVAQVMQRFFKTGKGQYGEGDVFLGLKVPQSRLIAKKYIDLSLSDIKKLLSSKIHEERLIALLILVDKFSKGDKREKDTIVQFYLRSTRYINNWDLVDLSADKIVGAYLRDRPRNILQKLARSQDIWERRIAMIATFNFIKNGELSDALKIAAMLLRDKHDLIHKAVGWMLREIGKRSRETEEKFLRQHAKSMPRTMLRYAIEHFTEKSRKFYMQKRR